MPGPLDQQTLKSYLDSLPVDKGTKAAAWDSYYKHASDPGAFASAFQGLNLPREAKIGLYDSTFRGQKLSPYQPPQAPTPGPFAGMHLPGMDDIRNLVGPHPLQDMWEGVKGILGGSGDAPVSSPEVSGALWSHLEKQAAAGNTQAQDAIKARQATEQPLVHVTDRPGYQRALDPNSQNVISRGITGGLKVAEGLTSPSNIGTLATMGVAPETFSKATGLGFAAQMLPEAASQAGTAVSALSHGQTGQAAEAGVQALATGTMGTLGAVHGLKEEPVKTAPPRPIQATTPPAVEQAPAVAAPAPETPSQRVSLSIEELRARAMQRQKKATPEVPKVTNAEEAKAAVAQKTTDAIAELQRQKDELLGRNVPTEGLGPGEVLRSPQGNIVEPAATGGFHEMTETGITHHAELPEGTTKEPLSSMSDLRAAAEKQILEEDHEEANRLQAETPGPNPSVEPAPTRTPEQTATEKPVYDALGKVIRLRQLVTGNQIDQDIQTVRAGLKAKEPTEGMPEALARLQKAFPNTTDPAELLAKSEELQGKVPAEQPTIQYLRAGAKKISDPAMKAKLEASRQAMIQEFNTTQDPELKAKLDKALELDENGNPKNVLFVRQMQSPKPVDLATDHPEFPFAPKAFGASAPELSLDNLEAALGRRPRTLMENASKSERDQLANVQDATKALAPPKEQVAELGQRLKTLIQGASKEEQGLVAKMQKAATSEEKEGLLAKIPGAFGDRLRAINKELDIAASRRTAAQKVAPGQEILNEDSQIEKPIKNQASSELTDLKTEIYSNSLAREYQSAREDLGRAVQKWEAAGGHLGDSPLIADVAKLPGRMKRGLPESLLGKKPSPTEAPATPEVAAGETAAGTKTPSETLSPGAKAVMGKAKALVQRIQEFPDTVEHLQIIVAAAEEVAKGNRYPSALYRGLRIFHEGLKANAPDALQKALTAVKRDPESGFAQNPWAPGQSPFTPQETEQIASYTADNILRRYEAMPPALRLQYKESIWAEDLSRLVSESNDPAIAQRYEGVKRGLPASVSPTISLMNKFVDWTRARQLSAAAQSVIRQVSGNRYVEDLRTRNLMQRFDELVDQIPEAEKYRFMDNMEQGAPQAVGVVSNLPQAFKDKWEKKWDFPLVSLDDVAQLLRQHLDVARDRVINETGRLQNYIEDYLPHIFVNVGAAKDFAKDWLSHRPLEGDKSFLREREHVFVQDAVAHGLQLATTNPVRLSLMRIEQLNRFTMAHQIKNEFTASQLAQKFSYGSQPAGWVALDDNLFEPKTFSPQTGGLTLRGQYYAPEAVARVFNNFVSKGLTGKWKIPYTQLSLYDAVRGYSNLANQFQLSLSLFHASESFFNSAISEGALGLQSLVGGRPWDAVKRLGNAATIVGPGLRDVYYGSHLMANINDSSKFVQMSQASRDFQLANGRLSIDPFFRTRFQDSLKDTWNRATDELRPTGDRAKAFAALPFKAAGRLVEKTAVPIMDYLVPRIKLGAFYQMAHQVHEDFAGQPQDVITRELQKSWDSVDNRFGQVVYENLFFMNRSVKDGLSLAMRSPGWNIGTVREVGGGALDLAKTLAGAARGQRPRLSSRAAYTIALAGFTAYLNGVYQISHPGAPKPEGLDFLFPRNGTKDADGQWNRVYPKLYTYDFVNLVHHPAQTIMHKESPLISTISDLVTNSNYFGHEIYDPSDSGAKKLAAMAKFALVEQYKPLSVENWQERSLREDQSFRSLIESSAAILPAPKWAGQTKAENLAYDYYQTHKEKGPEDDAAFERKAEFIRLRNAVREGKFDPDRLQSALDRGVITPREINYLFQTKTQTNLEIWSKQLTASQIRNVWSAADDTEKEKLLPVVFQKIGNMTGTPQQEFLADIKRWSDSR